MKKMKHAAVLSSLLSLYSVGAFAADCEPLPQPVSYFNPGTKAYFLAVDGCMRDFFVELGFARKAKPSRAYYANLVEVTSGFPNNAFFYSEKLKTSFEAANEDNVYRSIVLGLGFTRGNPPEGAGYARSDRDLILDLWICCDHAAQKWVACGRLSLEERHKEHSSYEYCER